MLKSCRLFLCCLFCLMIGSSIGAYCDVVSTLSYNVTSCFQYIESNLVGGNSGGILKIPAVFVVSEASGETLAKYVGPTDASSGNSTWCNILAISFVIPFAMSAPLATCFVVRRHRIRRENTRTCTRRVRAFHTTSTSSTCAVCLKDYNMGEKLTTLPCCLHQFHAVCVKAWLATWRTFCPVCKRDARTSSVEPPASESTPLLMSSTTTSAPAPSVSCSRPHQESHSIYTHRPLTVTCPQYSPFIMRSHFRVTQPPSVFK
ncbi:hypothetical protein ACP275_03G118200 [Erythranthe tilingii]